MAKTYTVINQTMKPLVLEGGVHLSAGGREGSRREGVALTEGDFRRLVSRNAILALEETAPDVKKKDGGAAAGEKS